MNKKKDLVEECRTKLEMMNHFIYEVQDFIEEDSLFADEVVDAQRVLRFLKKTSDEAEAVCSTALESLEI